MKRLFIAINLSQQLKDSITRIIADIDADILGCTSGSPCLRESAFRWLPAEQWHLTISFLGYQPDEAIGQILNSIKETIKDFSAPVVEFEKVILAPPDKPAKMIWLTGGKETSQILGQLKNSLENNLVKNGVKFQRESRLYNAHLTLARFRAISKSFQLPQLPNYQLPITFYAQSLDLMESYLKRSGAEYEILAELTFSGK